MRISTSLCCFILLGIASLGGQSVPEYGKHLAYSKTGYTTAPIQKEFRMETPTDFHWTSQPSTRAAGSSPSQHLEAAMYLLTGQEKKAGRCSERIRYVF